MLVFLPQLRTGTGFDPQFLSVKEPERHNKISFNEAIKKAAPAVVNIYSVSVGYNNRSPLFYQRQTERTSLGSGVIMDENGYILTCLHVIQNADYIGVVTSDGQIHEAQQIGYDSLTDLAVLKINPTNLHYIPQMEDPQTQVGDMVLAIGNPYNLGQTVTQGIVGATGRSRFSSTGVAGYANFIQTDAVLNEGNSGGALVDTNGTLVGINNANYKTLDNRRRIKDVPGVFFAVPYKLAKKVMDSIITNGRVVRGYLGVSGQDVEGQGFVITEVVPRGPADRANLRINDILLAVDGERLNGAAHALDLVAETQPGTVLEFEVSRNNQVLTVPINIEELPSSNG